MTISEWLAKKCSPVEFRPDILRADESENAKRFRPYRSGRSGHLHWTAENLCVTASAYSVSSTHYAIVPSGSLLTSAVARNLWTHLKLIKVVPCISQMCVSPFCSKLFFKHRIKKLIPLCWPFSNLIIGRIISLMNTLVHSVSHSSTTYNRQNIVKKCKAPLKKGGSL